MELARNILRFAWDVFNNWAGYSTGGIVIALVGFWHSFRNAKVGRKLAIGLAALFLFMAAFKAWNDQRINALRAQQQLDDSTKPNFVVSVPGSRTIFATDKNETIFALMVSVLNKGAPSTITGYQVHYHSLTIDSDFSPIQLVRPLVSPFEGVNYVLSNNDNLIVKMSDSEIPRGSARSGRLFIEVPGNHLEEMSQPTTKVTVKITDYLGKQSSGDDYGRPYSDVPTGMPGEEAQPLPPKTKP